MYKLPFKDSKYKIHFNSEDIVRPGFHLQQTPRPRHKKQSDYWVGRRRGRNRLYGNQAYEVLLVISCLS